MDFELVIAELVKQGFSVTETKNSGAGFGDRENTLSFDDSYFRVLSDKGQVSISIKLENGQAVDLSDLVRAAELCRLPSIFSSGWEGAGVLELLSKIIEVKDLTLRPDVVAAVSTLWKERSASFMALSSKSWQKLPSLRFVSVEQAI